MKLDPFEKDKLLTAVEILRSFIENIDIEKKCASCNYYQEIDGKCGKFSLVIPEHIIKVGCPDWDFDSIPF